MVNFGRKRGGGGGSPLNSPLFIIYDAPAEPNRSLFILELIYSGLFINPEREREREREREILIPSQSTRRRETLPRARRQ
jgi:hypothetical protein